MSAKQKALGRTLDFYKNLPGELRTLALIAGIFVPTLAVGSIFYFVQDITGIRDKWVSMAILIGVILGITLIVLLVNGASKWRGRSRAKKIGREMLSEQSARPTSMSDREAIKQNNQKFGTAVAEMKQTYGVSVYTLPWYIVIGESGCGKTRLINESNLEFPSGKPEGHAVGTLNYNWWFTQDMIFLDMAGRLVNPAEDKDHAEWLGVLRTMRKGRPACPINGAVVCVAADEDLLNVSTDKLRANADNMLLRLRELQRELGVTFPVYLVVTKCDKLLGFMEFFGRVTGKLALSTQIVGWSREGEQFNAAYDPDNFKTSFEQLYRKMHQFRLRRLRDDVDEQARNAAYCFPEEFAQLRDPLLVYISTLFPFLKNQLVVKNLIFRGVYFTSATQQSEAVLGHLRSKLGEDAARAMARLSVLYTQPEPRFVKELLQKKVEPENGLVYRNDAQLQRNRRAARWLQAGTVMLALAAGAGFWWSYRAFSEVVKYPRQHARQTHRPMAQTFAPAGALVRTGELASDSDRMAEGRSRWLAGILSMGLGTDEPRSRLNEIRTGLIHERVLPVTAEQVGRGIDQFTLDEQPETQQTYLQALVSLMKWRRASAATGCVPDCVRIDELQRMARIAAPPDDAAAGASLWDWQLAQGATYVLAGASASQPADQSATATTGFAASMERYFRELEPRRDRARNPAVHFARSDDALKRGAARLAKLREPWARLERGDADLGDPDLTALIRMARDCRAAQVEFEAFLSSCANPAIADAQAYEKLVQQVKTTAAAFSAALAKCAREGGATDRDLWTRLCNYRKRHWGDWHDALKNATCKPCGESGKALAAAAPDDLEKLDELLWKTLVDLHLAEGALPDSRFAADRQPPTFKTVTDAYAHIVRPEPAERPTRLVLTDEAREVDARVTAFAQSLAGGSAEGGTLSAWAQMVMDHGARSGSQQAVFDARNIKHVRWLPDRLNRIGTVFGPLLHRGRGTMLLRTLARTLGDYGQKGPWALAAWQARDWSVPAPSAYAITLPTEVIERLGAAASAPAAAPARQTTDLSVGISGESRGRLSSRAHEAPRCCTRPLLTETGLQAARLWTALGRLKAETDFMSDSSGGLAIDPAACQTQLSQLWAAYAQGYAEQWKNVIAAAEVALPTATWAEISKYVDGQRYRELAARFGDFSQHVACAAYLDAETAGTKLGGWMTEASIDGDRTAPLRFYEAVSSALSAAFPGLQRPALDEEKSLAPWAADEARMAEAWELLRGDVRVGNTILADGAAPPGESGQRFSRMADLGPRAPWAGLAALTSSRRFEERACQLLAEEVRNLLTRRLTSAQGSGSREERCRKRDQLREQAQAIARALGGCAAAVDRIVAGNDSCCDPTVLADLRGVKVTFELLATLPPGLGKVANENAIDTCYKKVKFAVGGQRGEVKVQAAAGESLSHSAQKQVLSLNEVTAFEVEPFDGDTTEKPVVATRAVSQQFRSPKAFVDFLAQGGTRGGSGSYIKVHEFPTQTKDGKTPVIVRQAVQWTITGRVGTMSLEEFFRNCPE